MINEVKKFFITFGLPLGLFVIIDRMLNTQINKTTLSIFQIFLELFDGFMGKQNFGNYQFPQG
jgi:hypothetical protein